MHGLTAYHALKTQGSLKEGESVLVYGAAGGVGTLAVQMAKLMGASTVVATASSAEKLDLAGSLGADVLVNYAEEGWPGRVRGATGGRGADVILEMIGGGFVEGGLSCLAPFGQMVVFGAASGQASSVVPQGLMLKNHTISGFYLNGIVGRPELLGPSMGEILDWLAQGRLKPTVGGRYPLGKAAEAHADLEGRKTTGKVVLVPWGCWRLRQRAWSPCSSGWCRLTLSSPPKNRKLRKASKPSHEARLMRGRKMSATARIRSSEMALSAITPHKSYTKTT